MQKSVSLHNSSQPQFSSVQSTHTKGELRWIEHASYILDNSIRVPGTNFRFGLDPIIGLVPVVGELVTFGMSALLVWTLRRHGASGKLILRMVWNIVLDAIVGSIPLVGNLIDFGFKANQRNIQLLREYHFEGKHRGNAIGIWIAIVLLIIGWIVGMIWLSVKLWEWVGSHWL